MSIRSRSRENPSEGHPNLTILGGGPAGLAAAYFARRAGVSFVLLEASSRTGGNAVTFEEGPFRFDSGAHRFHGKDPEMTEVVKSLLGDDLLTCDVPSTVFHRGRWIGFPLAPLNLMQGLGIRAFGHAVVSLVSARLRGGPKDESFEFRRLLPRTRHCGTVSPWLLREALGASV